MPSAKRSHDLLLAIRRSTRSLLQRAVLMGVVIAVTCNMGSGIPTWGQGNSGDIDWKTGRKLDQSNKFALSVWWNHSPIRSRLTSFSEHQKTGVFLDRRVDPMREISTGISNGTTEQFLWRIATNGDLGICRLGNFYYLGPPGMAEQLPLAWEELANESSTRMRNSDVNWKKRQPIHTRSAIQPRDLLTRLAQENNIEIVNLKTVPHDVWAKFQIPPTTLEGRFGIILAGFDKWFVRSSDGKSIEIVDFPNIQNGRVAFSGVDDARKKLKSLRSKFPNVKISAKAKTGLSARGSPQHIAQLHRHLVSEQSPLKSANSVQTFSLNQAQASRLSILQHIAKQVNSELELPSLLPDELNERVTLEKIKNVELSELVKLVLKDTTLKFEYESGKLTIIDR